MHQLAALEHRLAQGNVAPVYLFCGAEEYLRERALELIRKRLLSPQALEWDYHVLFGDEASPATIVQLATTPPFAGPYRLIIVRQAGFFRDPSGIPVLERYFGRPVRSTCLVFDTSTVDRNGSLFKALKAVGEFIEFAPVKKTLLYRWVLRTVREAGRQITDEAAKLLVQRAERLTDLAGELQKAIDFVGPGGSITVREVLQVTTPRVEDRIFAVLDAIGEKRYAEALAGLRNLLGCGENPHGVLATLARHFRLLLMAKDFTLRGGRAADLAGYLGVAPFIAKKLAVQADNFSGQQLQGALAGLLAADVAAKTGGGDYQATLEAFLAALWAGPP